MLKHFLLIITSFALIFSQDNNSREPALGQWRWNHESLEWAHDKETHAAGSFGLYYFLKYKTKLSTQNSIYTVMTLGLAKETLDALIPWEQYGSWGGDGWSNADLTANVLGIGTAWLIDKYWHPRSDIKLSVSFHYVR